MPKQRTAIKSTGKNRTDLWIALGLLAAVFAAWLQVLSFGFTTFDDPEYVTENPHVQAGLSLAGVKWAFTTSAAGSWFPVTWLSHMLDCQFFGLDSGWHHFTNACIHAATTVLWFLLLRRITGARWKSALVAFLFALHPLHVESVAWVCERKDVLSGLFCALTLWAYASWVSKGGATRYLATFALFCLGLMSKQMLVTLPIVLLLLDRWPFARGVKIVEKLPFFAASAAASVVAYLVHLSGKALPTFEQIPVGVRIENALVSYAVYLLDMIWPVNLAVFYPYTQDLLAPAIVSGIVIAAITVLVIRRPYLTVGWLWYLVTLLPVIGLIQAGAQARADRFTYLPMIGISIAAIWGAEEILASRPRVRWAAAIAICAACFVLTFIQIGYWKDSETLYRHAIAVTSNNYVARFNLASVLDAGGNSDQAIGELQETVRIKPSFALAHAELGQLLAKKGQSEQALAELKTAVMLKPDSADAHFRLGAVDGRLGKVDEAAAEFSEAVRLQPDNADAHFNLATALAQQNRLPEAARELQATVRLKPDDFNARFLLGLALARLGQTDQAIAQFSEAVRIRPDFADARQALADMKK